MGVSLATYDPPKDGAVQITRGLDPATLRRAGILGDPDSPEVALRRAHRLIEQGAYHEARGLLYPHQRNAPAGLRAHIQELLGVCAVHDGGDWRPLLDAALADYREASDTVGTARASRHIGEMLLVAGEFRAADELLAAAEHGYAAIGDLARRAQAATARARIRMRSGRLRLALDRIDAAITSLVPLAQPRAEGLARLDRACIVAYMGDGATSARELIAAERLLSASGNAGDVLRARLVRAETLLILGEHRRAAAGLACLATQVNASDDLLTRAWYNELLGGATAERDPVEARRHLSRARHLYEEVRSALGVATCEVALARVEARLGLNPSARLKGMKAGEVAKWPLVASEMRLVRAELMAKENPEQSRRQLLEVRAFALGNGNRVLMERVDALLIALRLVTSDQVNELAPLEDEPTTPLGQSPMTRLKAPPGGPQPMEQGKLFDKSWSGAVSARTPVR
jgi:tetratricopeptide (TPR) repeat protein